VVSLNDQHYANDLKATPDGGVIFCGQATDLSGDPNDVLNPPQQGWICKLDACGCLVPSCDPNCIVGVEEKATEEFHAFKVGPNPANDLLNIYLPPNSISENKQAQFVFYDMQGKVIKTFQPHRDDVTYIVDVADLPVGNYLLQLEIENKALESLRVEIVR